MVRISDARMSGTSYGACVLHVAPESHVGGPLALVRDGDVIELDVAAPPARPRRLRRGAGEAPGRLAAAAGQVRPRLRRAVPAAHHPGQRGLRLRLPRSRRARPRARDPLRWRSCSSAASGVAAASGAVEEITSPYDGTVVGTVAAGRARATCESAVAAAVDGAAIWRRTPAARAAAHPAAGGGPRRRAGRRSPRDQRRERQDDPRGDGRGARCGDADPPRRVRGRPPLRRDAAARRRPGTGLDKIGFTIRQPCGVVAGDHPVQLPGSAGAAQGRAGAGGRQRGRPQARRAHAAHGAGAGRLLPRRRPARTRVLSVVTGHGSEIGDALVGRPAGAQGVVHGVDGGRRADRAARRGQEALAGAGRLVPGDHPAGRGPRPGRRARWRPAGTPTPARSASRCSG